MKKTFFKLTLLAIITAAFFSSCKKDDDQIDVPPPVVNEPEVITTLTVHFIDSSNTSNTVTATFRDPDGDGGLSYDIFDTIRLANNKTWYAEVILLNETTSPVDTISNEVLEEANDHLFCFSPNGTSATVNITDLDGNSLPIGLLSKWKTTSTGTGTMQIVLKHQPGIKDGNCTPGDTDIDITFQVEIQ
jgi:hypothetical protein